MDHTSINSPPPHTRLIPDVIRLIFESFVTTWEHEIEVKDTIEWNALFDFLVTICQVSKYWREIAQSTPRLWRNVVLGLPSVDEFGNTAHCIHPDMSIQRSKAVLINLHVYHHEGNFNSGILHDQRIRTIFPRLQTLSIINTSSQFNPSKDILAPILAHAQACGQGPPFKSLRAFTLLSTPSYIRETTLVEMLYMLPNLITLSLSDFVMAWAVDNIDREKPCAYFPQSRRLRLTALDLDCVHDLLIPLDAPNLEELAILLQRHTTQHEVNPLPLHSVRTLTVSGKINGCHLATLLRMTPNVRRLQLLNISFDPLEEDDVGQPDYRTLEYELLQMCLAPRLTSIFAANIDARLAAALASAIYRPRNQLAIHTGNGDEPSNDLSIDEQVFRRAAKGYLEVQKWTTFEEDMYSLVDSTLR